MQCMQLIADSYAQITTATGRFSGTEDAWLADMQLASSMVRDMLLRCCT